jgi:hypothetical protein
MSTPDSIVSDEEGWWKHDGHSTVTGSNVSTSSSGESSENPEKNNNEGEDSEEIPEFPGLAIPFIAVMGIAMFFNRK